MSQLDPSLNIQQVGRCPYCGDEVEIEPTDLCCGEVHGEYVYEDDDGNQYTEAEYQAWLIAQDF